MMAYLDLSPFPFAISVAPAQVVATSVAEATLTRTERTVISLSLRDPVWSVAPSGRFRRILNWVFDVRRPNPLADTRLEALRRFTVLVRRFGDRLDRVEADRPAMAGYSPRQIRDAVRHVASIHAGAAVGGRR
jgi:hypothetical protein